MEAPLNEVLIADEDEKCGHIFYHKQSMLLKYFCLFCEKTYDNIHHYCEHLSEHVYESSQIEEDLEPDLKENESSFNSLENDIKEEICENESSINADDVSNWNENSNDANFPAEEDYVSKDEDDQQLQDEMIIPDDNTTNNTHLTAHALEPQQAQDEKLNSQYEHEESTLIVGDTFITAMSIKKEPPTEATNLSLMQFTCYTCKHNFPNLMCLKEHRCKNQSIGRNPVIHKCGDCNELFNETTDLNKHIREVHHANEIICRYCGRSNFNTNEALLEHMNTKHDNEEIFKCYICGRRYYLEANLLPHVWRHAKRVPQSCVVCGKITLRLQHHMKFKHSPRPTRLLQCSICNKTFSYTSSLSRHKLLHKLPRTTIAKTVRIDHSNPKKRRKRGKFEVSIINEATAAAVETQAAVQNIL